MPRFCVGSRSNRGIARALTSAKENLGLAQCKLSFIRVLPRLIQAAAYLSLAQNPRLIQATGRLMLSAAFVKHELIKMNRVIR